MAHVRTVITKTGKVSLDKQVNITISGPVASGKTTIARVVADAIADKFGRADVTIYDDTLQTPDQHQRAVGFFSGRGITVSIATTHRNPDGSAPAAFPPSELAGRAEIMYRSGPQGWLITSGTKHAQLYLDVNNVSEDEPLSYERAVEFVNRAAKDGYTTLQLDT